MKTIFFDLDGTLLDMDMNDFVVNYYRLLTEYVAKHGYDPQRFMKALDNGLESMLRNDGTSSNEEVFWKAMEEEFGPEVHDSKKMFEKFYLEEFQTISQFTGPNKEIMNFIEDVKEKAPLVLATNPLFPSMATASRMKWGGLDGEDFDLITTYENSRFCKPNPLYYEDLLERLNLKPEDVLMVGNDLYEDGAAKSLGIDVFILEPNLLHEDKNVFGVDQIGDISALRKKVEEFLNGNPSNH